MIEQITPTVDSPLVAATDAAAPRVDPGAAWAGPQEVRTSAGDGPALIMFGQADDGLASADDGLACAGGGCALPTADSVC
jgi:hypothetical protein